MILLQFSVQDDRKETVTEEKGQKRESGPRLWLRGRKESISLRTYNRIFRNVRYKKWQGLKARSTRKRNIKEY